MDQITAPFAAPDEQVEERDHRFNAHRFAASENAKAIVSEVTRLLLHYEVHIGLKKNKRRAKDQETFDLTVDAILSDLMHHHLTEQGGDIYTTRSNRLLATKSRYRPRAYNKMFPYILDLMGKPEMGFIMQDVPPPLRGLTHSTVIRPGASLLSRIEEYDIGLNDFGEQPHGETIILKRTKDADDFWDKGDLKEYGDTDVTDQFRRELDEINHWLTSADLRFDRAGIPWPHTAFHIGDRQLRRIFTQDRFDSGGRLFGGFWQRLRKHERRQGLWISGEKAIELDYGQVGPRILYGLAGQEPPAEDLYHLWGYVQQRDGIKRVMNAMIFASERLERFPKHTRKLFRNGDKIGEVVEAIEAKHPLIRDQFHRGLGHEAQFIESQIVVEIMLTLKAKGIVALPIHDAVLVQASKRTIVTDIMLSIFKQRTGVEGTVSVE
ncbi:hypothetical protein G6L45_15280 [Agrobacterium rhizogenes]|nr:hypothetical protein [Rhizobium rhizogenes]NTG81167.1 hypothetical protein [Rhizobium rhizogenes]NTH96849.1 hypothetical protein [Rhizobium rhizogenes]NTJ15035.1 hypothetical protein [Rhizobium rhizogenes]